MLMEPVLKWTKKDLVTEVSGPIGILQNAFTPPGEVKDPKRTIAAVKSIETSDYEVLKDFHASSEGKIIMRSQIADCQDFVYILYVISIYLFVFYI